MDQLGGKLVELFRQFPGIGPRQARRFVYFLMSREKGYTATLSRLITELSEKTRQCTECFRVFSNSYNKDSSLCDWCRDPARDRSILMVVEKDLDLESVRKTGLHQGRFFVLGGLVPLVEETLPKGVRLAELLEAVKFAGFSGELKEVIIALAANPAADHTAEYLVAQLKPLAEKFKIKISTLGRGFSTGTELEYSDAETLKHALKNRS